MSALAGKTVLITGANTGLGFQTSLEMAQQGASVFMACRNKDKGIQAVIRVRKQCGPMAQVNLIVLDLADLEQTRKTAQMIAERIGKIDVLVCNAGVFRETFEVNAMCGLEQHFAVNHLGHFVLVKHLMDVILAAEKPRVVVLTSSAQNRCGLDGIDYDSLTMDKKLNGMDLYGQSKLANMLFVAGLQERFGDKVVVNSVHPGEVNTDIFRPPRFSFFWWITPIVWLYKRVKFMSPVKAVQTVMHAAVSPEVEQPSLRGRYFVPFGVVSSKHHVLAMDRAAAQKLWLFSEFVCAKF
ncbi:Retinol dehydrogenase 12 [Podochytrium sp. JEL0797]|nr:Retinol dehydrogenase 12 [Podochytrium sp. JEL0797]